MTKGSVEIGGTAAAVAAVYRTVVSDVFPSRFMIGAKKQDAQGVLFLVEISGIEPLTS